MALLLQENKKGGVDHLFARAKVCPACGQEGRVLEWHRRSPCSVSLERPDLAQTNIMAELWGGGPAATGSCPGPAPSSPCPDRRTAPQVWPCSCFLGSSLPLKSRTEHKMPRLPLGRGVPELVWRKLGCVCGRRMDGEMSC